MVIVDTSVWIDYFNGVYCRETEILDNLLTSKILFIGDLILTETLQGFLDDKNYELAKHELMNLPFVEMLGREIAILSAIHHRNLRKRGITVRKTIDVVIATFCIRNELMLLHNDKDINVMVDTLGLRVY